MSACRGGTQAALGKQRLAQLESTFGGGLERRQQIVTLDSIGDSQRSLICAWPVGRWHPHACWESAFMPSKATSPLTAMAIGQCLGTRCCQSRARRPALAHW